MEMPVEARPGIPTPSASVRLRAARAWLPALALVPFLLLVFRFSFVCDDAFISFRYARNVARGLGLRYNVGEEPPVEGYSELLWVLTMAIVEWLRGDLTFWSRVLSIAAGVTLLLRVVGFVRRRVSGSTLVTAGAGVFFATLPPVAVWSTGGLATMPFALGVFLLFERLAGEIDLRRAVTAGGIGLVVALLRADGLYWVVLTGGVALAGRLLDRRAVPVRAFLVYGVVVALGFGVYEAWRLAYHGEWVPNTAQAKVALTPEAFQSGAFYAIVQFLTIVSLPVVAAAGFACLRGPSADVAARALAMAAGAVAYAVLCGGDFMCFGRFLVPAVAFVAILFAIVADRLARSRSGPRAAASFAAINIALSLFPAWNVHVVPISLRERFHFQWNADRFYNEYEHWETMRRHTVEWTRLGRALRLATHDGESLVHANIGAVGYYSELTIYDQFGLISREPVHGAPETRRTSPGHRKYVPAEFFRERKPTYFGAKLVTIADPSPFVGKWTPDGSGRVEIRMFPLREHGGFGRDEVLVLARWRG
jgi:arabinofuranosyltransferase